MYICSAPEPDDCPSLADASLHELVRSQRHLNCSEIHLAEHRGGQADQDERDSETDELVAVLVCLVLPHFPGILRCDVRLDRRVLPLRQRERLSS